MKNSRRSLSIILFFALSSFFLLLESFGQFAKAQVPPIEWQKSLGGNRPDGVSSIQQTTDGGYIVAGSSYSNDGDVSGNHGDEDCWIVKLDSNGNLKWQESLGGTRDDGASFIQQTSDGGFIVAGESASNDDDVSGNHGSSDYWIVKLDSAGIIEWQNSFGGSGVDYATSIQQTLDGGFIVAGSSESNDGNVSGNHLTYNYGDSVPSRDYWIVKLNSFGNIIWQKSFGGSSDDAANSIQQTIDGGYVICGSSWSWNDGDVSGSFGNGDYWVIKIDSLGNLLWQKVLGGSDIDIAWSVRQTNDEGFIVGGVSSSLDGEVTGNHGSTDYWIVKLTSSGNLMWEKSFGGTLADPGLSVEQTTDGGFIVAGYSKSNDGNVSGNHGGYDFWILKLNINGNLIWEKSLGGSLDDYGHSVDKPRMEVLSSEVHPILMTVILQAITEVPTPQIFGL